MNTHNASEPEVAEYDEEQPTVLPENFVDLIDAYVAHIDSTVAKHNGNASEVSMSLLQSIGDLAEKAHLWAYEQEAIISGTVGCLRPLYERLQIVEDAFPDVSDRPAINIRKVQLRDTVHQLYKMLEEGDYV